MAYREIRLILGDQLNHHHSWFSQVDDGVLYIIAELKQEQAYVKHHIQKICAFFAAMQYFAAHLRQQGHHLHYLNLDSTAQFTDLSALLKHLFLQYQCEVFQYQRPDEKRLRLQLQTLSSDLNMAVTECDTEHFLLDFEQIFKSFKPNKAHRIESFYRKMRKAHNILMEQDEPAGGQWNYDSENRQKLSQNDIATLPQPLLFSTDVSAIIARINQHHIVHFGKAETQLIWPVTRTQSLELLKYFCEHLLPLFGRFQDAMTYQSDSKWSLYHSRLSFALNAKLLHPKEVIEHAIRAYQTQPDKINLAQIEGFVRQILGWREFIRAIYWVNPDYSQHNALAATRPLPSWFWDGKTHMHCLQQAISQSLDYAYAHHIQRLMLIGNFALLSGLNLDEVDAWYLGVYIDALEWVEQPNTRGMALYGDGGIVASKPYAASANYIDKMSDYCQHCSYQKRQATGSKACPFNSLYWDFLHRHQDTLGKNPRLKFSYLSWQKMPADKRQSILSQAKYYLDNIQTL